MIRFSSIQQKSIDPNNKFGFRGMTERDAERVAAALSKHLGFEVTTYEGLGEYGLACADRHVPSNAMTRDSLIFMIGVFVTGYRQALADRWE